MVLRCVSWSVMPGWGQVRSKTLCAWELQIKVFGQWLMKIWNRTYSKGIGSKSLAGSAWCLGQSWCRHCFCLSLLCLPATGVMVNITAGNSLLVGARLTREEPPEDEECSHIIALFPLLSTQVDWGRNYTICNTSQINTLFRALPL